MSGGLKIGRFCLVRKEARLGEWPSRLPAGLNLLPHLLSAARRAGPNADALLGMLRVDNALADGVLAVSQKLYGSKLTSLRGAVAHLGERELYRVAAGVTGLLWFSEIEKNRPGALRLWRHALLCAAASHILAEHAGLDPELAYTAGMLHDIGKVVLWGEFGNDYVKLMADFEGIDGDLCAAERKQFALDHPTISARLLRQWKYPRAIRSAVQYHHRIQAVKSDDATNGLCRAIQMGNALAHLLNGQLDLTVTAGFGDETSESLKSAITEQFSRELEALQEVSTQTPDRN